MMNIVEDKRSNNNTNPPDDPTADTWADWKPLWTGAPRPLTPQDQQERHSPTETVSLRLDKERQARNRQRRIVDARLWEAMSPTQQDAALLIALSFEMMGRGMGYVTSNWQRLPGCKSSANVSEAHARLLNFYTEWAQKCAKRKISHAIIIDVLCFGFGTRTIDRDRRMKSGSARENLMQGLSLYCEMRGWSV